MFLYLIIFIISVGFFWFGRKDKEPIKSFIFYSICILVPVLIAALRDMTVGRDLSGYVIKSFSESLQNHHFDKFDKENTNEIGFLCLNWICSRVTKDIHFFLGINELIVFLFIFFSTKKIKSDRKALTLWIIFLFFLYNTSLSMIRQIVSISIIFYGTTHYYYGKKWMFFVCIGIAQLFHNSSVFALVIPIIQWVSTKFKNNIVFVYMLIILTAIVVSYSLSSIITFTADNVSSKYLFYMDQENQKSHKIDLLLFVCLFIGTYIYRTRNNFVCNSVRSFLVLYISILIMGSIIGTANRLALNILSPIAILYLSIYPITKQSKRMFYGLVLLFVFVFFYKAYRSSMEDTIPYTSSILGIE